MYVGFAHAKHSYHQPGRVFILSFSIPEAHLHPLPMLVTTPILKRNKVRVYKIQER